MNTILFIFTYNFWEKQNNNIKIKKNNCIDKLLEHFTTLLFKRKTNKKNTSELKYIIQIVFNSFNYILIELFTNRFVSTQESQFIQVCRRKNSVIINIINSNLKSRQI